MKTIFIALMIITATATFGQNFGNLEFGDSPAVTVEKLSKKSIVNVPVDDPSYNYFTGRIDSIDATVLTLYANEKLAKTVVIIKTDRTNVFGTYDKLQATLIKKYGEHKAYNIYESPYELGDGYETTAISLGYGHVNTFFDLPGVLVSIMIDKDLQVVIMYEHESWEKFVAKTDNVDEL